MDVHKIIIPTPFPVGDVNAYVLKGEALTLFDAGPKTEQAYEALKYGIKQAGYEMDDIEQVVLTHHHPDHAGWVDAFPNAKLLGHSYNDHWLKQQPDFMRYCQTFYKEQLQLQGVPDEFASKIIEFRHEIELVGNKAIDQYLTDGQEVPGHPGLITYETPGHAQSHLIFVETSTRHCIGGDLLLDKVSSNPLVEPPVSLTSERPKSLLQYNDSLKRIRNLGVTKVFGGHGDEVENVVELVNERLAKQHQRAMKVKDMLDSPKTVFAVTQQLFPKIFTKQPGLTVSETLGQLDYLEAGQLIEVALVQDVLKYIRL